MRARSRACRAARARSRRYLRSTRSMKAERECFEPARRSSSARRSFESVMEVFSFIPPLYYHSIGPAIDARCSGQGRKDGEWGWRRGRKYWQEGFGAVRMAAASAGGTDGQKEQ